MAKYLGMITIKNHYVNFKPLYEFDNGGFKHLNQYDRQSLLPESSYGDINLYSKDTREHIDDRFTSETYYLIDLNFEDLEDNFNSDGYRNQTGYKIEMSNLQDGKIQKLNDIDRFYVLPEDAFEGSYKTNPILVINDLHVRENDEVVIVISDKENTIIGPFKVEYRVQDEKLIIKTGLQIQKYVLHGYQFKFNLSQYEDQIRRYEDQQTYIHLDKNECIAVDIDVITKEQLLLSFRDTLQESSFTDGKIDLDNINELVPKHLNSIFIGEDIPEDIQKSRCDAVTTFLTDEERLDETFSFISETIIGLLDKYQDKEQYRNMVRDLAEDQEFMSRIQRYEIIQEKIQEKQDELDKIKNESEELRTKFAEEQKANEENKYEQVSEEYKLEIEKLKAKKEEFDQQISEKQLQIAGYDNLEKLNEEVAYKEKREKELEANIQKLTEQIDSIFSNSTEAAMKLSLDGMLASHMVHQAAEWESQQNKQDYSNKINELKNIPRVINDKEQIIEKLVEKVQEYRPAYDKNTILNIFICYTQGFLTVFSGEPGTGKTSICKIIALALGLTVPEHIINDGITTRFIPVSVERGWTTKRDFIGYYNPLTKSFDSSNKKIFNAINIMDMEAKGYDTDMPFLILLDEANLSPMEYYWADFMNICDEIDCTSNINLGDDFSFNVSKQLRFVATINNDHTTESLSPRLVDRAWIIKLPKAKSGATKEVNLTNEGEEVVSWSTLVSAFGTDDDNISLMTGSAKDIYDELTNKCKSARISISSRVDHAIRKYWSVAQAVFENDMNYGIDASIVALDYAVAQRILPHIDGSGEKYESQLEDLHKFCSEKNLRISAEILSDIIYNGQVSMKYFQYFA